MYDSLPNTGIGCIFPSAQVLLTAVSYAGDGRFLVRVIPTSLPWTDLEHSFFSTICHPAWQLLTVQVTLGLTIRMITRIVFCPVDMIKVIAQIEPIEKGRRIGPFFEPFCHA
jgi:hypothetical protein